VNYNIQASKLAVESEALAKGSADYDKWIFNAGKDFSTQGMTTERLQVPAVAASASSLQISGSKPRKCPSRPTV